MSLLFPYVQLRARSPVFLLGGRLSRPRALIRVTVMAAGTTYITRCLLDTGADDTVFPQSVATALGIDLRNAPTGEVIGVAAGPSPVRYAQVTLRMTDGQELAEWTAWVGFTSAPLRYPLLGFAGCLQFFHAHFRGDREEVELTPDTLFTGRHGPLLPPAP